LPRRDLEGAPRAAAGGQVERLWGIHPVREALRARRRELRRLRVEKGNRRPGAEEILAAARDAAVPIEEVPAEQLAAALEPGSAPQGVVLEAGPLPEVMLEALADQGAAPRTLVALDGVEDPQNVGAIARVAEACGVGGMILTHRRSAPLGPAVSRASAGAIEWLPVTRVPNLRRSLNQLKKMGFWIFGAEPETAEDVFGLADRIVAGDRVLVLGAEGRGLRPGIRDVLDHRIRIPMEGRVASLNVASAAAVLLFELRRRSGSACS
jgi:23S rRNA (guanosine2251-2'-O)-methyltransferase